MKFVILACLFLCSTVPALAAKRYPLPRDPEGVQLFLGPAMEGDLRLTLRVDFRTGRLAADFLGYTEDGDPGLHCEFTAQITRAQVALVRRSMEALRYCKKRHDPNLAVDPMYFESLEVFTKFPSESVEYERAWYNGAGVTKYLCAGEAPFYQTMESLVVPLAPENCPKNYRALFETYADEESLR